MGEKTLNVILPAQPRPSGSDGRGQHDDADNTITIPFREGTFLIQVPKQNLPETSSDKSKPKKKKSSSIQGSSQQEPYQGPLPQGAYPQAAHPQAPLPQEPCRPCREFDFKVMKNSEYLAALYNDLNTIDKYGEEIVWSVIPIDKGSLIAKVPKSKPDSKPEQPALPKPSGSSEDISYEYKLMQCNELLHFLCSEMCSPRGFGEEISWSIIPLQDGSVIVKRPRRKQDTPEAWHRASLGAVEAPPKRRESSIKPLPNNGRRDSLKVVAAPTNGVKKQYSSEQKKESNTQVVNDSPTKQESDPLLSLKPGIIILTIPENAEGLLEEQEIVSASKASLPDQSKTNTNNNSSSSKIPQRETNNNKPTKNGSTREFTDYYKPKD